MSNDSHPIVAGTYLYDGLFSEDNVAQWCVVVGEDEGRSGDP